MNELNAGMNMTLWLAGIALSCAILALRHSPDTIERLCCWGIAWAHGKRAERAERERVYAAELKARSLSESPGQAGPLFCAECGVVPKLGELFYVDHLDRSLCGTCRTRDAVQYAFTSRLKHESDGRARGLREGDGHADNAAGV